MQSVQILEEAPVDLGDVIGGQVEDDEAVESAKDPALDPVLVQAVPGQVENLERGKGVDQLKSSRNTVLCFKPEVHIIKLYGAHLLTPIRKLDLFTILTRILLFL